MHKKIINPKNRLIMLKKILNLQDAQELSKNEQKSIIGGSAPICEEGYVAKRCFGTTPAHWECVVIFPSGPGPCDN